MKTWTVSRRLNLIIVTSVVMVATLVIVNWLSLDRLGQLQQTSQR